MKNYQADNRLAAFRWIGVLVVAQFTAVVANRRSQPRYFSAEAVRARTYLYFRRATLGIPETNRTGGKGDVLEAADQQCHCNQEFAVAFHLQGLQPNISWHEGLLLNQSADDELDGGFPCCNVVNG